MTSTTSKAEALLQGLQSGSLNQKPGALRRSSGKDNLTYVALLNIRTSVAESFFSGRTLLMRAVTDMLKDERPPKAIRARVAARTGTQI